MRYINKKNINYIKKIIFLCSFILVSCNSSKSTTSNSVIECSNAQHLEEKVCVSNTRSCDSISNGKGSQTWSNDAWGSCVIASCSTGYHKNGNICSLDTTRHTCFEFNSDRTQITDYFGVDTENAQPCPRDIVIPKGITSIGPDAFSDSELTSVVIPNGITSIGPRAFENNELASIIIPNSVTKIKSNAFASNKLTQVTIPDSVTYLSGFKDNLLTSIMIPNSVVTIGPRAFKNNKLTSIIIPNSVTEIKQDAFTGNLLDSVCIESGIGDLDIAGIFGIEPKFDDDCSSNN